MDDENEERRRGFRVTDRRRFAETGEPRADVVPERERETPAATPAGAARTVASPVEAGPAHAPEGAEEPVSFSTFVLGLSTQALFLLGEIPDPSTGTATRDLPAAKHVIDILGILGEKTRNNLEPGEQSLLDSVLYDLRMRYVELMRLGTKEG